MEMMSD